MKLLSDMLKDGCHFCKKPLAIETALCGTMSIKLTGTDIWSEPIPMLFCVECRQREAK